MTIDLRLGRWQDVLQDVECDALICDPPYGARTHDGHAQILRRDAEGGLTILPDGSSRRDLPYLSWDADDVREFVEAWAPRTRGWFVALTSHDLFKAYEDALHDAGRYVFHPIPCVIRGMTVRISGDGPSSWAVYAVVSRPKKQAFMSWGTLPGSYYCTRGENRTGKAYPGGKPLRLMIDIVTDYSRTGDLVCDPCAGSGTTLAAAAATGRRGIGSEMNEDAFSAAKERVDMPMQQRELFA